MYYFTISFQKRDLRQGLLASAVTLSVDIHQMAMLPANAGDIGSIPSLGRFHMLWDN